MTKLDVGAGLAKKPKQEPTNFSLPGYEISPGNYEKPNFSSSSLNKKLLCVTTFACLLSFSLIIILTIRRCTYLSERHQNELVRIESSVKWDEFVFCQLWPPASCLNPQTQNCTIPENVTYWTIHGLWPSKSNSSHDPEFCNKTWKFDIHEIEPIRNQMDLNWPDCYDGSPVTTFWKHEWEKHGTCAATVSALDSQLNYFSKTLNLHVNYNLTTMMANYTPSQHNKIAVVELLNKLHGSVGKNVTLQCTFHKKAVAPVLASIEICFNKNLMLIDCNSTDTNCNEDSVLYWPFPNNTRRQETKL